MFGITYMVLAPEHPLVEKLIAGSGKETQIRDFVRKVKSLSDIDRTSTEVEKVGLPLGVNCVNPLTGEKAPVLIANYVLLEYGTGCVMGVPAHDQRDFEFARKYNFPVRVVIQPAGVALEADEMLSAYEEEGFLVNSGRFNGLSNKEAIKAITAYLEEKDRV